MRIAGIQRRQVEAAAGRAVLPNKAACKQLCPASPHMGASPSVLLHLDASGCGVVTSVLPL